MQSSDLRGQVLKNPAAFFRFPSREARVFGAAEIRTFDPMLLPNASHDDLQPVLRFLRFQSNCSAMLDCEFRHFHAKIYHASRNE